ncbi:MAG TPA: hypothetical protein VGL55_01455 [Steroidobacteraceae bacterium]|jgi:3-hydroxymyristoyl/3-hydroxydecanoyl-(acyl carrier protein) dehydratase
MATPTGDSTRTDFPIAADHPTYAGHFPGAPVLPGVVLLDTLLQELAQSLERPAPRWQISSAKFLSAVRPGESLSLERESLANGSIRFVIRAAERIVAQGLLAPSEPPGSDDVHQG